MFEGFTARTIEFMWGIRLHNERSWFQEHKSEYQRDFLEPMKALGHDVFEKVTAGCEGRGFIHKVSRIYRDARRVKGGEPYRDHLWFSIERPSEEWTVTPVFWFELSPESWTYGMGYYQARAATMAKLRARIDRDPARFEKLIEPLAQQEEFVLDGPEYARKKAAPTPDTDAWYNKKSFSLIHEQENGEELFSPALADRLAAGYQFLMPFYDYVITLDEDPDPRQT